LKGSRRDFYSGVTVCRTRGGLVNSAAIRLVVDSRSEMDARKTESRAVAGVELRSAYTPHRTDDCSDDMSLLNAFRVIQANRFKQENK